MRIKAQAGPLGWTWLWPVLALGWLFASAVAAFPVTRFDAQSGLPSATTHAVAQDASGRLWIQTRGGLAVYDGADFQPVPRIDGVDTRYARYLLNDGSGRTWLFMQGWAGFVDRSHWEAVEPPPRLPDGVGGSTVAASTVDGTVRLLAGQSGELLRHDEQGWTAYEDWQPPGARLTGISSWREDGLIIVTSAGLCVLQADGPDCDILPIDDGYVRAATTTPDGIWVLSDRWLRRYRGFPEQPAVVAEYAVPDFRQVDERDRASLLVDHSGLLFATSANQAVVLDPSSREQCCESLQPYVGRGIQHIFEDRERQLWFSGENGLRRVGTRSIKIYDRRTGLLEAEASSLAVRADGTVVVGHNGGLSILGESGGVTTVRLPEPDQSDNYWPRVLEVLDHDGRTWFAASSAGFGWIDDSGELSLLSVPDQTHGYSLSPSGDGGIFLQAIRKLFRLTPAGEIEAVDAPAPRSFMRRVSRLRGELFQVAQDAVHRRDRDGQWHVATAPDGLELYAIQSFDGRVLVGSSRGLFELVDDRLVRIGEDELAVPELPVYGLEPFAGGLAIGTSDGVYLSGPDGLTHRSVEHGLPGRETNRGALVADGDVLWIGTERGVARYRPDLDAPAIAPLVDLLAMENRGREYSVRDALEFEHDEGQLEYRFRVVSPAGLDGVRVRTRLFGWESDWTATRPLDAANIRYVNLPAGEYEFAIQASRDGETWSAPVRSAPVTVKPALLDMPSVTLGLGALIAGAFAMLIVIQRRRERGANLDVLTGLPNRRYFMGRLQRAIRRGPGRGAVVFMDLNDFKTINDSFGHESGDRVLRRLAARLRREVGSDGLISRFGGDEFTLLLMDRAAATLLEGGGLLERLAAACSEAVEIGDARVQLSACFGVREFSAGDGTAAEILLRDADTAMYRAKALGRGEAVVYSDRMRIEAKQRLELENGIRLGIDEREFDCDFQPIVDLDGGRIVGLEALARWRTADGVRNPGEFLDAARRSGLVRDISLQVLDRALQAVRHWEFITREDFYVSVNASAVEIRDRRFAEDVDAALNRYGIHPRRLAIELTEEALIDRDRAVLEQLWHLRKQGVTFLIDDFGTGYSSFGYLNDLPVSTLKIDRTFVHDVTTSERKQKIVTAMISLAGKLQLNVVAEGIEEQGQHEFLRAAGCRFGQGYLYGRPAPRAATLERIEASMPPRNPRTASDEPAS